MPTTRPTLILETCLMCERLAPARFTVFRAPDVFGHERAPAQRRLAPLCTRCHNLLARAGARGLVETASGARWTLASAIPADGSEPRRAHGASPAPTGMSHPAAL